MNEASPRCSLYCRVSTQDQSCQLQLRELRAYCQIRNWTVVNEYIDEAKTGANTRRPAFRKMMDDATSRKFDVLLVLKLDRFS